MTTKTTAAPAGPGYEAALAEYQAGHEALRARDYARAQQHFDKVRAAAKQEPEMADRASVYSRICERRSTGGEGEPQGVEAMYRRAVFLLNAGELDSALTLLNRALVSEPTSVELLYVRACVWAHKGAAEKAVGDLRQALASDPKVRYQAMNDADFDRIREEPIFIDLIEPTSPGV